MNVRKPKNTKNILKAKKQKQAKTKQFHTDWLPYTLVMALDMVQL